MRILLGILLIYGFIVFAYKYIFNHNVDELMKTLWLLFLFIISLPFGGPGLGMNFFIVTFVVLGLGWFDKFRTRVKNRDGIAIGYILISILTFILVPIINNG